MDVGWGAPTCSSLIVDGTRVVEEDCASEVGISEDRDGFVAIGKTCTSFVEVAAG